MPSPCPPSGGQELLAGDDVDRGDAAAELLQGADGAGGDRPARQRGALDQAAVLGVLPAGAGGDPRPRQVHQHRLLAADGPPVGAAGVGDQRDGRRQRERDRDPRHA
jgi:hypothetical protein